MRRFPKPSMALRHPTNARDMAYVSPESAQSMAEYLDAQLSRRHSEPADMIRTLLLIADMRGLGNLSRECQLSCDTLKHQLHGTRAINFVTMMRVVRGLGFRLRAEALPPEE